MKSPQSALTGQTLIGTWLDHPEGGPVIRAALLQGLDEGALAKARDLPLQQLVAVSGGAVSQEVIDGIVRDLNGGVLVEEHPVEAVSANQRFADQIIIVTGAGSGIGRAVAKRIAAEGGHVVAVDISAERLTELADVLPEHSVTTVTADVTQQDDIDLVMETAGGYVDGLANVAGVNDDFSPAHETSDALWDRVMAINVNGPFKLLRAVLPGMLERRAGSIVNVASEAGLRGNVSGNAYTVSKHAVVGLTKSAAVMYGPEGIRVNGVAPGGVATGIPLGGEKSSFGSNRLQPFHDTMPPLATPEAVAASITFLLSRDGTNVNGVILPSDGGWSAQ